MLLLFAVAYFKHKNVNMGTTTPEKKPSAAKFCRLMNQAMLYPFQ
jgi:hypothetical protein